ncbi:competence protein ComK [Salibacterium aidingense]|uniref:competence protein ComK n=1 Tax=Salibacterium aidingense TaxID=384933 RepID=UPI003BE40CDC
MEGFKEIRKTYDVVQKTMGLVSVFDKEARTLVYETGGTIVFTEERTRDIMERACLRGGSSMDGRFTYVEKMLGMKQRKPIPVNEGWGIYAFPLFGQKRLDNSWFFYSHISHAQTDKTDGRTYLVFYNGQRVPVDVSLHQIRQQILKVSRCKTMFEDRNHRGE